MLVSGRELKPQSLRLEPTVVREVEADGLGRVGEKATNLRSPTDLSRLLHILGTWRPSPEFEAWHQSVLDIGRNVLLRFTLAPTRY